MSNISINTLRSYPDLGLSSIKNLKGICGKTSTPDGTTAGIYPLYKYKPEALAGNSSPTLVERQTNNYSLTFPAFGSSYMSVFQNSTTETAFRSSWKWGYSFSTSSYPSRLTDWDGFRAEGTRDYEYWEDVGYYSTGSVNYSEERRGIPGGFIQIYQSGSSDPGQINMNIVSGSNDLVSLTDLPFFQNKYLGMVAATVAYVYFYANGTTIGNGGRQLTVGGTSIQGGEILRLFPVAFSSVDSSMTSGWVRTTGTYGGNVYSLNGTLLVWNTES